MAGFDEAAFDPCEGGHNARGIGEALDPAARIESFDSVGIGIWRRERDTHQETEDNLEELRFAGM